MQFQNIFNIKCKSTDRNAQCFCQAEYITKAVIKSKNVGMQGINKTGEYVEELFRKIFFDYRFYFF